MLDINKMVAQEHPLPRRHAATSSNWTPGPKTWPSRWRDRTGWN